MIVVRMLKNLPRVTRAEHVYRDQREMNLGGTGISEVNTEMRDKTHRGEGPPR